MSIKLPEIFRVNGESFSKQDLLDFSAQKLANKNTSGWELEVYAFIKNFFDEAVELEQFTSGTTGKPKKMILQRSSMLASASMTLKYFHMQERERALLCLPVKYIAGKMMIVRALLGGLDLLTAEPSGNPLRELNEKVSFAAMVPIQVFNSLASGADFSLVETLLIGGGEIHSELRKQLRDINKCNVYESFAMTETYSHIALRRINHYEGESSLGRRNKAEGQAESTETTKKDSTVKKTFGSETFQTLPGINIESDDRGCLIVQAHDITDDRIITNDLVDIVSENAFRWLGRYDNVINTGGIKIIPEILETKIASVLGFDGVLIGIPDQKLGEKMLLILEEKNDIGKKEIFQRLSEQLSSHEIPKDIRKIESFPRNDAYKIDRKALKA